MISKRSGKTRKEIPSMTTMITGKDYLCNEDIPGDDDDEAESTPYQAPEKQPKPGTFDPTQRSPKNGWKRHCQAQHPATSSPTESKQSSLSLITSNLKHLKRRSLLFLAQLCSDVINETITRRRSTNEEFNCRAERYDGTAAADERRHIVQNFNRTSYGPTVLLLSAHTGGTGLNLTGPSRVILCEP
ncbi:hypothetical protein NXS19_001130 [Fusarium pseudograminearum]|uniref:Helicase C-terminal domain-containing protein n=1 Tax=Fusarium pseudograminearum (strain CS3096) TaxID=1028729 RepID=K3U944_FUSPC|nr:hypothetical protein FPSE_12048 [Fusarium pseudograminearum CS3096]EKJ67776.1 hypothetical protein FPSE_12048 [Fusarium pseudograminearum CS3096]KAF0643512.1 hypothetical protein FPSE5266_12048 [Fusarium pseudograminearum]UZP33314.1 hypothetical protein NXS19_001130 [Fusarium pseudograminearum]